MSKYDQLLKLINKNNVVVAFVNNKDGELHRIRLVTKEDCQYDFVAADRDYTGFTRCCFLGKKKHKSRAMIEKMEEHDLKRGLTIVHLQVW